MAKQKKEKIFACDFIRLICSIGIVLFHYFCHNTGAKLFLNFANGDFGCTLVNIFFILSGAMLYYNNGDKDKLSLKSFYYKRFISLLPMYYIAYFIMYVLRCVENKNIFWGGNPVKLVLTLFGMDGYLNEVISGYYILGEWFLGAIILIYILFPLINYIFNRSVFLSTIIFTVIFVTFILFREKMIFTDYRNFLYCVVNFYLGFVFIKYKKLLTGNVSFIISLIFSVLILFVKVPFISKFIMMFVLAFSLFIVLYRVGEFATKNNALRIKISNLSKLTYAVFLTHHVILIALLSVYDPQNIALMILFILFDLILTFVVSWLLFLVTNKVLKTSFFTWLNKKLK